MVRLGLLANRVAWIAVQPFFAPGLAAVVAFVGILFRQRGVPRYLTVWAEDGQIFGQCALNDQPVHCLFTSYDGWIQTMPRLLAIVATAFPIALFSYLVTLLAAGVTAVCAALVARAIAGATRSPSAGFVAGASLALVSMAATEVGGNITNLPWIMFIASAVILVAGLLGRAPSPADLGLAIVTITSSPLGLLLTPLMGVQAWARRDSSRRARSSLVLATVLTVGQLLVATGGRKTIPYPPVSVLTPIRWLLDLVRSGPFGGHGLIPGWVISVAVALGVAALAWRASQSEPSRNDGRSRDASGHMGRLPEAWQPIVAIGTLLALVAVEFGLVTYLNRLVAPRHEYVPAVGLVVALLITAAFISQAAGASTGNVHSVLRLTSRMMLPVACVVVLLGFATTFRATTPASQGPSYPAALQAAAESCANGGAEAIVPIAPTPQRVGGTKWSMNVPCNRIDH